MKRKPADPHADPAQVVPTDNSKSAMKRRAALVNRQNLPALTLDVLLHQVYPLPWRVTQGTVIVDAEGKIVLVMQHSRTMAARAAADHITWLINTLSER